MSTLAEAISGEGAQDNPARPRTDRFVVSVAGVAALVLGGLIWQIGSPRLAWLYLIGAGLGVALYHAAFGFTAGWRNFSVQLKDGELL